MQSSGYTLDQANEKYEDIKALGNGAEANNWISPWPQYYGTGSSCIVEDYNIVCNNGIVVDQRNWTATLYVEQGTAPVASLVYLDELGKFQEKILSEDPETVGISVGLIPTNNGYNGIIIDYNLATSMFHRLFFYSGHGLSCFDLFDSQRQVTGGDIYVWKIDWECASENEIYSVNVVTEVEVTTDVVDEDLIAEETSDGESTEEIAEEDLAVN
jgi:hypothetical protein